MRAEVDERTESVGRKIRDAELRKIPYMLVVGDREQEAQQVAVREHRRGDEGSRTGWTSSSSGCDKLVQSRSTPQEPPLYSRSLTQALIHIGPVTA